MKAIIGRDYSIAPEKASNNETKPDIYCGHCGNLGYKRDKYGKMLCKKHWDYFYHKPRKAPEKIGRNNPCPCGSGKKYKNCCEVL